MKDFQFQNFSGHWYEFARTPSFSKLNENDTEFVRQDSKGNTWTIARILDSDGISYNVTRDTTTIGNDTGLYPQGFIYTFLEVDYDDYGFIYACKDLENSQHEEVFWFLTREEIPRPEVFEKICFLLNKYKLSIDDLESRNNFRCNNEANNNTDDRK